MPSKVDLSELLHTPLMRVPLDVDVPCTPELEMDCVSPVRGRVVFTNTGNLLVIQGKVNVTLRTECPRCLTPVESHVDAIVDEEFTVAQDHVTGRAEDDDGFKDPTLQAMWEDGHMLNLTELLRQSLVLAVVIEPLCREDCQGLCPQCGANWNEASCDCETPVDSPFAVLAGLVKDREATPAEDE